MSKTWGDWLIEIPSGATEEVDTTCPRCSHARKNKRAKCLSVHVGKECWLCHHCGWKGSLKEGEQNPSTPWKYKPAVYAKPTYSVDLEWTNEFWAWCQSRGLTRDVLEKAKVSRGCVYMPQVERHENVIQFPYYRGGELVNVKYRTIEGKHFRMVKDAERILYGLPDICHEGSLAPTVTIVEGEVDKLSLAVAGIWECVSVPDGAPPVGSKDLAIKLDYLEKSQELLDKIPQFVLAVDNEGPGRALEQELIRRLGPDRCARVVWPDGCKDANEVLVTYGPDTLRDMIQNAQPVALRGVMGVEAFEEEVRALYHNGMEKGLSTGWANVDTIYTIRPGHLTVVTGIPSHGKSTWVDALCVELANEHDWRIGMFSPENYPYYLHVKNLIEKVWKRPFDQLSAEEVEEGLAWARGRFFWIGMEEEFTLEQLLTQAKGLVTRFGIRGLVLDPWNEIEHLRTDRWSETEYISLCMSQLRTFARIHQVHVWLVAHPTKLYRTKDGKYPIPGPYDISGSAHFRNKADWCLTIWRDLDYAKSREVQVHCQKVRFREFGQIGMQILEWLPEQGGIYQPSVAVNAGGAVTCPP